MKLPIIIFTASLIFGVAALSYFGYGHDLNFGQSGTGEAKKVAQFDEPLFTVALHSPARLKKDLNYLVSEVGLTKQNVRQIKSDTKEFWDYVHAIDADRPVAVMGWLSEKSPTTKMPELIFCFPSSDTEKFAEMLTKHGKVTECALGWIYKPNDGKKKLIREDGGYLYVSENPKRLRKVLPVNFEETLNSLLGDKLAAVKIDTRKVSLEQKNQLLDFLKDNQTNFMGLQESVFTNVVSQYNKNLIENTEFVLASLNLDKSTNKFRLDTKLLVAEGSQIAQDSSRDLALQGTRFANFQNDKNSAMRLRLQSANAEKILKGLQTDLNRHFESRKTQTVQKTKDSNDPVNSKLSDKLEVMITQAIESGHFEFAFNQYFDDRQLNMLIAARVHDTSLLSELIQMHKEQDESPFKDLEGFKGIKQQGDLTTILLDSPEHQNFFDGFPFSASNLAVIAFDKQAVYMATGEKGPKRLKQLLDDSNGSSAGLACESSFGVNVTPFLRIFMPHQIAANKDLERGDEATVQFTPIENGYGSNLSVDLGLVTTFFKTAAKQGRSQHPRFQANHRSTPSIRGTSRPRTKRSNKNGFDSLSDKQKRDFERGFLEGLKKSQR